MPSRVEPRGQAARLLKTRQHRSSSRTHFEKSIENEFRGIWDRSCPVGFENQKRSFVRNEERSNIGRCERALIQLQPGNISTTFDGLVESDRGIMLGLVVWEQPYAFPCWWADCS
jgi:hypothetical protein